MLSALLQSNYQDTPVTRDPYAPAQFTAGWYYGIAQKDKRDDILDCFKTDEDLTNTLYNAMEAYIAGDTTSGDAKISETKPLYEKALAGCGDIAVHMGEWAQKTDDMMERSDWQQISQEIYQANKDLIDRDVDLELREWQEGVFFNSGMFAGQISQVFLSNLPADELSYDFKDKYVPAQFYAGWYYGLTTHDKRDKILDCYEPS